MTIPLTFDEVDSSVWSGTASLVVRYLDLWLAGEMPGPPTNVALPELLLMTACEFINGALAALPDPSSESCAVRRMARPRVLAEHEAEFVCLAMAFEVFAAQWPREAATSDSVRSILEVCRDTLRAVHKGDRSEVLREAVQLTWIFFVGIRDQAVSGRYTAFAAASIEV